MTKQISLLIGLLFLILGNGYAQDEKRALAVLDAMSNRYQSFTSYKATFTYSSQGGRPAQGEATVKGGKFYLKMADQEVLSDGKVLATYLKESNEVTLQDYNEDEIGDLSPTRIYRAYKQGYKYAFMGETQVNGRTYENVRLIPTASNSPISNVELQIDKADKSIKGWKIFSKGNESTQFTVTQFQSNIAVNDNLFTFDAKRFPGVEVIDLR